MALEAEQKAELVTIAYEVQKLLLEDFKRILTEHKCSPTDRATMARYLKDNNYRVDANDLPPDLIRMMAEMGVSVKRTMPEA